jgi:hypothetical protein
MWPQHHMLPRCDLCNSCRYKDGRDKDGRAVQTAVGVNTHSVNPGAEALSTLCQAL